MKENKIIPKIKTTVTVEVIEATKQLDAQHKFFTEIHPYYSKEKDNYPNKGIVTYLSLFELIECSNSLPSNLEKNEAPAILKGLYEGGTSGVDCYRATPFLAFDIDVSKKENVKLLDAKKNSDVWDYMKQISVLAFRSHSGHGMAGFLYVPHLESILNTDRELHKKIGQEITIKLSRDIENLTGLRVVFDNAQSTFRQIRYVPRQNDSIELNPSPKQFEISIKEEEMTTVSGVVQYTYNTSQTDTGSIYYQYNKDVNIEDKLVECGFEKVSDGRYHNSSSKSSSTGMVNPETNTFYSHSSTYGVGLYTPSKLHQTYHELTNKGLYNYIYNKGYREAPIEKNKVEQAIESLNYDRLGSMDIFKICDPLKRLPIDQKYALIAQLEVGELEMKCVHEYLQCTDLSINYSRRFSVKEYMSEAMIELIKYVELQSRTCIYADTGLGKTTAFINSFKRSISTRAIFLVPLQSIAYQIHEDHSVPYLTGESDSRMHSKAKVSNIFVATYEQGVKYLGDTKYDYVIIDEGHNLITANSYKSDVISELNHKLSIIKSKVILLTGSPLNIFHFMGYDLIEVVKERIVKTKINERITKLTGYETLMSHVLTNDDKILIRYNNISDLELAKEVLCRDHGYKEDEIMVLQSSREVKRSKLYQQLLKDKKFDDIIQIVLTTSVIDEGISIKQDGFSSVVFIETKKGELRPEELKQFFARFRNIDTKRKNYLYRKLPNTNSTYFNENDFMYHASNMLASESGGYHSSYKDIFNNTLFYYSDSNVNLGYLANYTTDILFKSLTGNQFNYYLENNYNLRIERDVNFKELKIDQTHKKLSKKEKEARLCEVWVEDFETVLTMLRTQSSNKTIRDDLFDEPDVFNEEVAGFIEDNLKRFEMLYGYWKRFLRFNLISFITNNGKIRGTQALENKLYSLESIALINNPRTENDKLKRRKLIHFIETLTGKGTFTKQDIETEFKSVSPVMVCSNEAILLVLKAFATITYDKRKKQYKVGKNSNSIVLIK